MSPCAWDIRKFGTSSCTPTEGPPSFVKDNRFRRFSPFTFCEWSWSGEGVPSTGQTFSPFVDHPSLRRSYGSFTAQILLQYFTPERNLADRLPARSPLTKFCMSELIISSEKHVLPHIVYTKYQRFRNTTDPALKIL